MIVLICVLLGASFSDSLAEQRINELGQISTSDNSEYVSGVKSYYNRTFSAILALSQIFLVFELTLLFLPKKSELWWRSYLNVFLKGLLFLIPVLIFPTMYMDYPAPVYLHLLGYNLAMFLIFVSILLAIFSLSKSKIFSTFIMQIFYLVLFGSVFYANPIVESATNTLTRSSIINFILSINPMIMGSAIINVDLIRMPFLYDNSVIQFYNFEYPAQIGLLGLIIMPFVFILLSLLFYKLRYNKLFAIKTTEGEIN